MKEVAAEQKLDAIVSPLSSLAFQSFPFLSCHVFRQAFNSSRALRHQYSSTLMSPLAQPGRQAACGAGERLHVLLAARNSSPRPDRLDLDLLHGILKFTLFNILSTHFRVLGPFCFPLANFCPRRFFSFSLPFLVSRMPPHSGKALRGYFYYILF